MTPPSPALRPYVWSYGMTTGRVDHVPLVVPLPARPKQLMTFFFADRYGVYDPATSKRNLHPRTIVVGPQTESQAGISVLGRIDNFTVHFQPSGFNQLFGIPMTELTDTACDAHAVIQRHIFALEHELEDAPGFAAKIAVVERHLIAVLAGRPRPDLVARAANYLFASHGRERVLTVAADAGLSVRHFERRFLAQVGVTPKLYARIIRFNAALDGKLQSPERAWTQIAQDREYHDQMHLLRDCREFTGLSPSQFLARLAGLTPFHTLFASADRARAG